MPDCVKVKRLYSSFGCVAKLSWIFKTGCVQVVGIQHAATASNRIVIEVSLRHIPEYSRSFASFAGGIGKMITSRVIIIFPTPQPHFAEAFFVNIEICRRLMVFAPGGAAGEICELHPFDIRV